MDINVKSARGAGGCKTSKTVVLPWFCKIELGGDSGGVPLCYGVLSWLKFSPILGDATECCEISNTTLSRFYLKNLSHFNEILFEILPASLELSHVLVDMVFRIENFDVWLNTQQGNGYKKKEHHSSKLTSQFQYLRKYSEFGGAKYQVETFGIL